MRPILLLLPSFFTACSDAALTQKNAIPTANITYPANGDTFQERYTYTLRGMVGDPNHDFSQLRTNWIINGEPHCTDVQPDTGGLSQCTVVFDLNDSEITLEVVDPNGASAVDYASIIVEPTEAPMAEILSPNTSSILYADQITTLSGLISDAEDNTLDLNVEWRSNIDGILTGDFTIPDANGVVLGGIYLSKGEHFLTLEVTDSTGKNTRDAVTVTVLDTNTPPQCAITFPTMDSILTNDAPIALSGTAMDNESTALSIEWHSNVDGVLGSSTADSNGNTLLAVNQMTLGVHTLTLTVTDDADGLCTDTVEFTVNTPPTQPVLVLTPSTPDTTMDLQVSATGSTDPDGASIFYTYQWLVNGLDVQVNIDTLSNSFTQKGDLIRTIVTPNDGLSDGTSAFLETTIINAPPVIQGPTLSSLNPAVGTTVQCSATGTDPDPIDTLTTTYQWSNGMTGPVYTIQASEPVNSTLSCMATLDDGDGGVVQASAAATIANTAPSNSISINPSNPSGNDTINCLITASDPNNHPLTHTVSWTHNGQSIPHTMISTLESTVSGPFVANDTLECQVITSDGFGGTSVATDMVIITNTPPVINNITLSPSSLYTNDVLSVTATATDADGDSLTMTYAWFVDGQLVQSGSSSTLDGSQNNTFDKHQTIYVTATASDGLDTRSLTSGNIIVNNSLPTAPGLSLNPTAPTTGDAIECIVSTPSQDLDGDPLSYLIDWDVDGAPYFGAGTTTITGDTVPLGVSQSSETWTCTVTPDDTEGLGPSTSISTTPCNAILSFNGGSDRVTLDPLTSMPNDKTMEAWVRLDAAPSNNVQLMSSQCAAVWITPTEINVGTINGCLGASGGCKSGYNNSTSWVNSNRPGGDGGFLYTGWDGTWKHIAITITSSEVAKLYIDGTLFDTAVLSSDGCISSTTIGTIGRHNVYGGSLVGDVAEVRMSSSIEYSGNFTPQYPLPVTNSTEVLYGLQNDFGLSTLTDDSGNGINANINGTGWNLGGPACP